MFLRVMVEQLAFCLMALAASVKVQVPRGAMLDDGAASAVVNAPRSSRELIMVRRSLRAEKEEKCTSAEVEAK